MGTLSYKMGIFALGTYAFLILSLAYNLMFLNITRNLREKIILFSFRLKGLNFGNADRLGGRGRPACRCLAEIGERLRNPVTPPGGVRG
jgi:hypothetical protein